MAGNRDTIARPYGAYNFGVRVNGVNAGHFTHCSGLDVEITPIRYREAGAGQIIHHFAGPVRHALVTLRYGVTDSFELWEWFSAGMQGRTEHRNVTISLLDMDGVTEKVHWNLFNAWPSRWRGALFDALSDEMAIESVSICYARIERDPPGR